MKSALGAILGLSMLALAGCDGGGGDGPNAVGNAGTTGSGGGGNAPEGVPLTPENGWVPISGNNIGIQGALFAYADDTSKLNMTADVSGANACIKGSAAKVDKACMAPAGMDCFGVYWGAALGLNLNQPIDPNTNMGKMPPDPYNASALKGFYFKIEGTSVPTTLRFKVEDMSGEYCTPATKQVKVGDNTVLFEELMQQCWKPPASPVTAVGAKGALLKIAWHVTTKDTMEIPYDFCVSEIRALLQ